MAYGRMLLLLSSGFAIALPQHAAAQGNPWHAADNSRPAMQQNGGSWQSSGRYGSSWSTAPAGRFSDRRYDRQQSGFRWRGGNARTDNGSWPSSSRPSNYQFDRSYNNGSNAQQAFGEQASGAGSYPPAGYRPSSRNHRRQNIAAPIASGSAQSGPTSSRPAAMLANSAGTHLRATAGRNPMPEGGQVQGRFVPNFAAGQFGPYRLSGPPLPTGDYPPMDGDPASLHAMPMPRQGAPPVSGPGAYDRAARAPRQAWPRYARPPQTGRQQTGRQQYEPQQYASGSTWPAYGAPPVNQQRRPASPDFAGPSTFGNPYGGLYGGGGLGIGGGPYGGGIGLVPGMGLGTGLGGFPWGGRTLDIY